MCTEKEDILNSEDLLVELVSYSSTSLTRPTDAFMSHLLQFVTQDQIALFASTGCSAEDIEHLAGTATCFFTTPPSGMSIRKAVTLSKALFGDCMHSKCAQCSVAIDCFRFTLSRRDHGFQLECGKHDMQQHWTRNCSPFKAAVWMFRFGADALEGTCCVCKDAETCVLHVLDDWQMCHDVARANNGDVTLQNIAPGYAACNMAQGTRTFSEYGVSIGLGVDTARPNSKVYATEFRAVFPKAPKRLLEQFLSS